MSSRRRSGGACTSPCLPMDDPDENAVMVNALQRRADVVVQKSLAEGFGLTVAEAMWKGRPVVASRVGGIQDQIEDGTTGFLVDPGDLRAFGERASALLADPHAAERMGQAAQTRVREPVPRPAPPRPVRRAAGEACSPTLGAGQPQAFADGGQRVGACGTRPSPPARRAWR